MESLKFRVRDKRTTELILSCYCMRIMHLPKSISKDQVSSRFDTDKRLSAGWLAKVFLAIYVGKFLTEISSLIIRNNLMKLLWMKIESIVPTSFFQSPLTKLKNELVDMIQ